jgi:uncharacterized integral membrane protein (TIGR00698 family)
MTSDPKKTGFLPGLIVSAVVAAAGYWVAKLPILSIIGPLAVALVIAMILKAIVTPPVDYKSGFTYAAKDLLRFGIILLGVRLNFDLILGAGWKILVLDLAVILFSLFFFRWISRLFGLEESMGWLVAIGSGICGASAIVAATPVVRAREDESALALVLVTVIGTVAALALIAAQAALGWSALNYGAVAGSSLHEVAQVLAAVTPVPAALDVGTVTKLVRVLLLAPVILVLVAVLHRRGGEAKINVQFPWFVVGFFAVGVLNYLVLRATGQDPIVKSIGNWMLFSGLFLMTMGMAGLGLLVDYARLREHGLRASLAFVVGWFGLFGFSLASCWLLGL